MDRSRHVSTLFSSTLKTAVPFFIIIGLIASCSGGGGGSSTPVAATSLSGSVIDAPVTGAAITITENAPLGQQGAVTLGTTTADQYGKYSLSGIPIPKTSAPIYASSQGGSIYGTENPDILLTAYLGQGQDLAAAGSDLGEGNDPDLAVSQVTTAAVALASNGGKNYQISGYQATLTADQTQLVELSSEIMCQVDAQTPLPSGGNTLSFVNGLVAQNPPGPNTDYLTVSGAITCSNITTYMNMLTASGDWDTELDGGDTPVSSINIPAGTYSLEGLIEGTGIEEPTSTSNTSPSTPSLIPFTISLSVAADGTVSNPPNSSNTLSISSESTISGQLLKLILTNGSGETYTLKGALKLLPATWHTAPTQAFLFQGGGSDSNGSSNTLSNVNAVLYSGQDSPQWSAFAPIDGQENITCNNGGFKLRITIPSSNSVPVFPVCLTEKSPTTLSLTNISNSQGEGENHDEYHPGSSTTPSSIGATLVAATDTPFIVSAPLTIGTAATNTMFYVLGSNGAFVTSYGSAQSTPPCTLSAPCVSGDTAGSIYFSGNIIPLPQNDH